MEEYNSVISNYNIINLISKIHEYKGKQSFLLDTKKDTLETLLKVAKIQSTSSSNKIEGIYTTDKRINEINGVSCIMPQGAFYIMMNIDQIIGHTIYGKMINGSDDFAELFLEKALVAIVPCSGFGADNYLRWSYATSMESIQKGLDRLEKFIIEGLDK